MIGTILTTLGSLGLGLFKGHLENKRKDAEHKRQLELEREITIREKERFDAEERIKDKEHSAKVLEAVTKASAETTVSAHNHDIEVRSKVGGGVFNTVLTVLSGIIRPCVTIMFVLLYIWAIKFFADKVIIILEKMPPTNATYGMYKDFLLTILDSNFWAVFSSILGFWFGHRISSKR